MIVAIDLDGTLGKYEQLIKLALKLREGGATVIIMTACAGELKPQDRQLEACLRVSKYLDIFKFPVIWSDNKAEACEKLGVDILIDDKEQKVYGKTMQLKCE